MDRHTECNNGDWGNELRVKDVNGKLTEGSEDVQSGWGQRFSEMLNVHDVREASIVAVGRGKRIFVGGEWN